jgi:hypothetical protein
METEGIDDATWPRKVVVVVVSLVLCRPDLMNDPVT